jgi:hypothetical protein
MSTDNWIAAAGALLNFCALVGLIVSILILNKQTRLSTRAALAAVYQGISDQMHDIDKVFVDNPTLRPHFYADEPLPNDRVERERVMALAELIVDFSDNFLVQCPVLPDEYERGWLVYFKALYGSSPAMREYLLQNGHWYAADLQRLYRTAEDEISSRSVASPAA